MLQANAMKDRLVAVAKLDEKPQTSDLSRADKATVLGEVRHFKESPLNPRTCCQVLTKILYLRGTGVRFTEEETTEVFFGATRLFQSTHDKLRRLVFLLIKTLQISDQEVFVVTSSLTKDMGSNNEAYRANAIRVLRKIADVSLTSQLERHMKSALVDSSNHVKSAALLCALELLKTAPEVVRRWINEISSCTSSKSSMVQFHALVVLFELKRGDPLALQKVVSTAASSSSRTTSSSTQDVLICRYAKHAILSDGDSALQKQLLDHLLACCSESAEPPVMLEAMKALCDIVIAGPSPSRKTDVSGQLLTAIQTLVVSPAALVRFSAVRLLNKLSQHCPGFAGRCNDHTEPLLTDSHKGIATLALTTLLKTGNESSVEKMVRQASGLMSELSEAFRVEVVKSVRQLCVLYPKKQKALITFLYSNLREEGSFELKSQVVESLILFSGENMAVTESAMLHLCEFIEDCEYPLICNAILVYLGETVPLAKNPAKFIRFIYNRLILETASVRAGAVNALTKIATLCPKMRPDIVQLLRFCKCDCDDEVRERTRSYLRVMGKLGDCPPDEEEDDAEAEYLDGRSRSSTVASISETLDPNVPVAVDALCEALAPFAEGTAAAATFSLSSVATEEEFKSRAKPVVRPVAAAFGVPAEIPEEAPIVPPTSAQPEPAESVMDSMRMAAASFVSPDELGTKFHSFPAKLLTEKEAEYAVSLTKFVFPSYMVLEFLVTNTMLDQTLEDVSVRLSGRGSSVLGSTVVACMAPTDPAKVYSVIKRVPGVQKATLDAELVFTVKETGDDLGYEDTYSVEPIELQPGDDIAPRPLRPGQFAAAWDAAASVEKVGKFALPQKSVKAAVQSLVEQLGGSVCDLSDALPDDRRESHNLLLSGCYDGEADTLVRATVVMSEHGCLLKLVARSSDPKVCDRIIGGF